MDVLTPAYVIHTRPFQDNKILLDLLTLDQGLVRAVWRLPKKDQRVMPASFLRYQTLLKGRNELKTLHLLEADTSAAQLVGLKLYSAMYVHELLLKLLPMNLPLQHLFNLYQWLIESLITEAPIAPLLRRFEYALFEEAGSSINLSSTATGEVLEPEVLYRFDRHFGLRPDYGEQLKHSPLFYIEGRLAIAYSEGNWGRTDVVKAAKEIHRNWLDHLLEGKKIEARKLLPAYEYDGEYRANVPVFRASV